MKAVARKTAAKKRRKRIWDEVNVGCLAQGIVPGIERWIPVFVGLKEFREG